MGSSYSRRTRSTASSRSKTRSKVGSTSTDTDQDNNISALNSESNFTHERKDSKKFWISHVRFRKRSSGDIQVRRSSSERKPETRSNPKSTSEEQTRRSSKTGLNKSLSFDAAHQSSSYTSKVNSNGPEKTTVSSPGSKREEKEGLDENSGVVNQNINLKNMSLSVSQLYNILNDGALSPCICDPTYILLIDTRSKQEYDANHILMARHVTYVTTDLQEKNIYGFPSNVNISEFTWVVIYGDELTDDVNDNNDEIKLMRELDSSYNTEPFILVSGFKSFYKTFPFLCSDQDKVDFKTLQVYPSTILDNQLYQGRGDQATSLKVIDDLQITHIVNITQEHASAFPEKVSYLTLKLDDVSHTQLIKHFDKTTDFIINALSSGGRVLVHCNLGVSRSSTVSIAYLIHANKWTLRQAYDFLKDKRTCIRPNRGFLKQLAVWEELKLGKKHTDPDDLWF